MAFAFDPFGEEALRDPYPHYRALRDAGPCVRLATREGDLWAVGRYADVCAVAKNTKVFSSTGGVGPRFAPHPMMSMYDPPVEHGRMRRVIAEFFTPAALGSFRQRFYDEALARLEPAAATGAFDGYRDLGLPLSYGVLAELMGLPRDRDDDIKRWTDATKDDLGGGLTPERQREAAAEIGEFVAYLSELTRHRLAHGDEKGFLTAVVRAHEAGTINKREMLAMCVHVIAAGFGTTASAIAGMVWALAEHPAEWHALRRDRSRVRHAVEESLRWDGPVQSFFRNTLEAGSIGGVDVPQGAKVMLLFASANRDERRFPDPDRFLVGRDADGHLAFGHGPHFCLGGPLSRIAMGAILTAALDRFSTLAVAGPPAREPSVLFREFSALPLAVRPLEGA